MFVPLLWSLLATFLFCNAQAASAAQWRDRSIYQQVESNFIPSLFFDYAFHRVIIDRYALPNGSDPTLCDPSEQTWLVISNIFALRNDSCLH